MERGTEWEQQAVRERWNAMERSHAVGTRLLGGLVLILGGLLLLLLAVSNEVCFITARGGVINCAPMTVPPLGLVFAFLGVIVLGSGLWRCSTILRD